MSFRIIGLPHAEFAHYFAMNAQELAGTGARLVVADADRGFPCRVSLEDARAGERLILLNYVSHDGEHPYRTAHAIYVREATKGGREWIDCLPPVFMGRTMSLRGFDADGMMQNAVLAMPDEIEQKILRLFENTRIAFIHAHNAAYGCYAARIDRHGN